MTRFFHGLTFLALLCGLVAAPLTGSGIAQTELSLDERPTGELSSKDGKWEYWKAERGVVAVRELQLIPRAEAKPALSVRLIPSGFDLKDGNAAVFYLQAMAFLEQTAAQQAKWDFEKESREAAMESDLSIDQAPPHVWRITAPEDLPLDEVKEYLTYTSFQQRFLKEAILRKDCDFDRRIREVENPVMFLLPEVQALRELARTQSLRFLVAIAEDRVDDAVSIFGQQLALGAHLSEEPFLVSNLVGIACASIGWYDAFYLMEHPDAPNLYWAVAALRRPLVDVRMSMSYERNFLFEQIKILRDVDTTPRSDLYWKRFLDEFTEAMVGINDGFSLENQPFGDLSGSAGKAGLTLAIASGVPGARRYLHEVENFSFETLDSLPNTQVFFLAVRRYYERSRDEFFKLQLLDHWEREKLAPAIDEEFERTVAEYGWLTVPSRLLLPAIRAAMTAQTRMEQSLNLLQTIESIRHHLATHEHQLPRSLEELDLPVPIDPVSGKSFQYKLHPKGATLAGAPMPGYRIRFELRVAKQ